MLVPARQPQAAACIREAVALGVLPQFLLKSLQRQVTPSASELACAAAKAATSSQQEQQLDPPGSNKRPRDDTEQAAGAERAAEEPPRKLHRLACGSSIDGAAAEPAAAAGSAAAAVDTAAEPVAAEAAEESQRKLDRNLSSSSTKSEAATVQECNEKPVQQQQQQQQPELMDCQPCPSAVAADLAIKELPQISSQAPPTTAAAGGSLFDVQQQQHAAMSSAARDLFLRTVMVMSRSQRHCKQLAYMVLPAAQEAQAARQAVQAQQQQAVQPLDVQGLLALQGVVQQLKQQLMLAKASLSMKQQALLRLQQESQATTALHTQQLEGIGQAVKAIMAMTQDSGMRAGDKQKLVGIAADILKAVVQ